MLLDRESGEVSEEVADSLHRGGRPPQGPVQTFTPLTTRRETLRRYLRLTFTTWYAPSVRAVGSGAVGLGTASQQAERVRGLGDPRDPQAGALLEAEGGDDAVASEIDRAECVPRVCAEPAAPGPRRGQAAGEVEAVPARVPGARAGGDGDERHRLAGRGGVASSRRSVCRERQRQDQDSDDGDPSQAHARRVIVHAARCHSRASETTSPGGMVLMSGYVVVHLDEVDEVEHRECRLARAGHPRDENLPQHRKARALKLAGRWPRSSCSTMRSGSPPPVRRFAAALRDAGHTVHTPDLFDGRTFEHDRGRDGLLRGDRRADGGRRPRPRGGRVVAERRRLRRLLPRRAGGAVARPDAAGRGGAVLCYSALPLGEWGDNWPATWPDGVRLQLHILERRGRRVRAGARGDRDGAELFVYPGTEHYFAEHDDEAAGLRTAGTLVFGRRLVLVDAHGVRR